MASAGGGGTMARAHWTRVMMVAAVLVVLSAGSAHGIDACPGLDLPSYQCSAKDASCEAACSNKYSSGVDGLAQRAACQSACDATVTKSSCVGNCRDDYCVTYPLCTPSIYPACEVGCDLIDQVKLCCAFCVLNCNAPRGQCIIGETQQYCNCQYGWTGGNCSQVAPTTELPPTTAPPTTLTPTITIGPPTTAPPTTAPPTTASPTTGPPTTAPPTTEPPTTTAPPSTTPSATTPSATNPPSSAGPAGTATPTGVSDGSNANDQQNLGLIIGVVVAAVVVAVLVAVLLLVYRRRRSSASYAKGGGGPPMEMYMYQSQASLAPLAPASSAARKAPPADSTGNTTIVNAGGAVMPLPGYLSLNYVTDLRVDSKLGAGGGGTIYLGELLNATVRQQFGITSQVVIKHAIEHEDLTPAERQMSFEQEVIVMSTLSFHKNVVTLLGFCLDPHVLVLPYFPAGDLANLIADPTLSISFIHAYELAHDMASALQAAHSLGIVHRDVKTANFLIEAAQRPGGGDPLYIARLTDFGVCRIKESGPRLAGQKFLNLFGLSVRYAAPEVFSRLQLSTTMEIAFEDETKTDVYAYAICLWEVLSRQVPWGTQTREEITQAVTRGQRPSMPTATGDALQAALLKLVVSCWDQTSRLRPTFSDVCRILDGMTALPSASSGRAPVPPGRPSNPSTLRRTAPAAPPPRPSANTTTMPIAPASSSTSNSGMSRTAPHVPPKPAAQAPRPPTLAPKPPAPAPKPPVLPPKTAAAEPPQRVHVAVYAYTATKEDEMNLAEGDQLVELEVSDDGWVKVVPLSDMNATPKWAPGNYLQLSG